MINRKKYKKMTYLIAIIVLVIILFYSFLEMNKFAKGVIDDTKRMDTISFPEVFYIESIKNDVKNEQRIFDDYLKAIPAIELPLNLKCDVEPVGSTLGFNDATIEKYGQKYSEIFGKIAVRENFAAIIYLYPADIVLPIIQTTDRQGNKIAEFKVYEEYCGADEFFWSTSWVTIMEDLTIVLKDSTIMYERNCEGEIIEETKKKEVRQRKFQIDNKGKINEKL